MIYVTDTSVVLSDPKALASLATERVVMPISVLVELEAKRNHPSLGYPARMALRYIESLRKVSDITDWVDTPEGGAFRIEMTEPDSALLPVNYRTEANDDHILGVAAMLQWAGEDVCLLSADLPLRLKAATVGLKAEVFIEKERPSLGEPVTLMVEDEAIDYFYEQGAIVLDEAQDLADNTSLILKSVTGKSALGRVRQDGLVMELIKNYSLPIEAKNAGQHFALDVLSDNSVGIVSLGGSAGSGKTLLALASAISALRNSEVKQIIVFRPVEAVGGQELGFLPGTAEEKMEPWSRAVYDALGAFMKPNEIRDVKLQVLPLSHIRGRTFRDTFIIVDEAQNLDLMTLVTAMSRLGEGSRIVLTHDISQRDNTNVGKYEGIHKVISTLSGNRLFAHVTLTKSERSKIADLIARSFDL